jgi:FkbM family methyltransferase
VSEYVDSELRRQRHKIFFYKTFTQSLLNSHKFEPEVLDFLKFCFEHDEYSYSQFLQDLWVIFMSNLKQGGYFVEFGAADGIENSNTYALEKHFGWTGLLIEPVPTSFKKLSKNRSSTCVKGCIATCEDKTSQLVMTDYPQFSSVKGFHLSDMHAKKREVAKQTISVPAYDLNTLLEQNPPPNNTIDYLSIDVEGAETAILPRIDFERWQFKLITCEHNFRAEDMNFMLDFFSRKGYTLFPTEAFAGG